MGTEMIRDGSLSLKQVRDMEQGGMSKLGIHLKPCANCGSTGGFRKREKDRHLFWRVVCFSCGMGTWCTEDGYGHMDENGRMLAALEWNERYGKGGRHAE